MSYSPLIVVQLCDRDSERDSVSRPSALERATSLRAELLCGMMRELRLFVASLPMVQSCIPKESPTRQQRMAMAVILLVGAMGPVRSSVKAQSEFRKKFTTPDGHLYTMDVNSDIAAVMQGACWNAAMSRRLPRGQHQSKCDRNRLLDKSDFIDSDSQIT